MAESLQHKLDRVRKPRVQITYDVELNGAMKIKELPFVVGVMGDFSGKPDQPLPAMKDRKFVEISRDNFDGVLAGMTPRLAFRVDDKLSGEKDKELGIELRFNSMEDFKPGNIAKQVKPLEKLQELRDKLADLKSKMDGNDKLEGLLDDILKNAELAKSLAPAPEAAQS